MKKYLFALAVAAAVIILVLVFYQAKSNTSDLLAAENGSLKIYFCPETNCTDIFLEKISSNSKCAFYDLSPYFYSFLKSKKVDVVLDEDNFDGYGTKIHGKGLMHNKFCVSEKIVITGSFNPTFRGELYNNNNVLVFESEYLAKNYLNEFENIKNSRDKKTPFPEIIFNNFSVKNFFCPRDSCQQKVLLELGKANKSIYFMAFSFTDDQIGELIIEKSKSLEVMGVMEKSQNNTYSEYEKLINCSVSVAWDTNKYNMHHKVFIIDNKTVITGSYNPTKNADENNYENIIIIENSLVADAFIKEFFRVYKPSAKV